MPTPYDEIALDYAAFVAAACNDPAHVLTVATECLLQEAGEVRALRACDLGCGEGHLARRLAARGARVVGVDNSQSLLRVAAQQSQDEAVEYVLDDGQHLPTLGSGEFDLVVSNFSLMDIPDLAATYAAVFRVLKPRGSFLFTITHPCFQLPRVAAAGEALVEDYFHEGFWSSAWKAGIRGRVGAHHRTLSTYLNGLVQAGFAVRTLFEPRTATDRIPKILLVSCHRPSHRNSSQEDPL
jgi:2-polyprenyl-3-methyl-5-hydroxy-6-metoxy-1,4-benzoquinol methylase